MDSKSTVSQAIVDAFAKNGATLSADSKISTLTPNSCWKITDKNQNYYIYNTNVEGSTKLEVYEYVTHSLMYSSKNAITPVTVIEVTGVNDPIDGPVFKELVAENIDSHLSEFNFVFATANIVKQLSEQDVWKWVSPTTISYAVAEPSENPTNDNSVLAILSMVGNNTNPEPVQQVNPNAIPDNCDSGFLISPSLFLENIVAKGVVPIFKDSSPADFDINFESLTVTNKKTVT